MSNSSKDKAVVIKLRDVHKTYDTGFRKIKAVQGVDLDIHSKDFVIIFGPSGCGKSTLLNIILGLDAPEKGKVFVRRKNVYSMTEDERAYFRTNRMGVVYQQPTWIKSLSVIDNVAFPLFLRGISTKSSHKLAMRQLEVVGMEKYRDHKPVELSGGQQQKVSLARAMANNPWTILLDEPTGNLDSKSGDNVIKLMRKINKEGKRTIIMVTHNYSYLLHANKVFHMVDGEIDGVYDSNLEIQKFIKDVILNIKQPQI